MRDRGTAAVEYLATIGFFLLVLFAALEAYTDFTTIERVESATRTCARVASMSGTAAGWAAGARSVPSWVDHTMITFPATAQDSVRCQISVRIQAVHGLPFEFTMTRRVELPVGG